MDIYLFRHGDTLQSKNLLFKFLGYPKNSRNVSILPEATPALKRIGAYLKYVKTDANFCSPYLRCRESVNIVSKECNFKYKTDERLSEYERTEKYPSLLKRVESFLQEMEVKHKTISICTHGAVIAAIKHLSTSGVFNSLQIFDYPKPGNLIVISNRSYKIIDFNSENS